MNPVISATNNLRIGLTVLQVLAVVNTVLGLLNLRQIAQVTNSVSPNEGPNVLPEFLNFLSAILGFKVAPVFYVLIVILGLVSIFVIGWIKDWQARVSGWSQGQSLDKTRLEQLSSTLSKWIVWSHWGPIIVIGIIGLCYIGIGIIFDLGRLISGDFSSYGILHGIFVFFAFLVASPLIVLNWLVLKNIKIWLLTVIDRALGHSGYTNLIGQSHTVSRWLVFSQVMVCVLAVYTMLSLTGGPTADSTVTQLTLVLLLGNAVLDFMLLQWTKTFMFGVAGYVEGYGSSAAELSKA